MFLFLDQKGDGRTHLNEKFGYWVFNQRLYSVTTTLHLTEWTVDCLGSSREVLHLWFLSADASHLRVQCYCMFGLQLHSVTSPLQHALRTVARCGRAGSRTVFYSGTWLAQNHIATLFWEMPYWYAAGPVQITVKVKVEVSHTCNRA